MACAITISNVTATNSGWDLTSLTVFGTATECAKIRVSVKCGSQLTQDVQVNVASGDWSAAFSAGDLAGFTSCSCNDICHVEAVCIDTDDRSCIAVQDEIIHCCPNVDLQVAQGQCQDNGTMPVTVTVTITPSVSTSLQLQAQLAMDGSVVDSGMGAQFQGLNLSYTGNLTSGSHTAKVTVMQPAGCEPTSNTFDVNCGPADSGEEDPLCKTTFRKWYCPHFFVIMSVAFTYSTALFILDTCFASPPLLAAASAFLALGTLAFMLYFPFCTKCLCGWFQKLLWRVLFGSGVIITAFAGSCPMLLLPGLGMMIVGLWLLNWWRKHCDKTACQVVKEVIFVLAILVVPVVTLIFTLAPVSASLLILFAIGSFVFTFIDLVLLALFFLVLYDNSNC
jgi:hypothetical protein